MRRVWWLFPLALLAYWLWATRAVSHPPGVLVPEDPVQTDLAPGAVAPFEKSGYRVTPLARYRIRARVLSTDSYHFGRESDLSPEDLAVGWGRMSDSAVLDKFADISQGSRFYFYRWSDAPPLPPNEIITHSANMHIIPATPGVARSLSDVRTGQIIDLSGYLVRVDATDGWHWVSSLSRGDTGDGACELMWVQHLDLPGS